jgi:hypothetical protein
MGRRPLIHGIDFRFFWPRHPLWWAQFMHGSPCSVGKVSEVSDIGSWSPEFLSSVEFPDGKPLTSLISLTTFDHLTSCLQAIGGW